MTITQVPWPAPRADGPVRAVVEVPGSKSATNRALVLSALAGGGTVTGALRSRDTDLMAGALVRLGHELWAGGPGDTTLLVGPAGAPTGAPIDCGLAGTVMRFLPPLAALYNGDILFDGDEQARVRPMRTVLDGLRALGVDVSGDTLPFTVHARGAAPGGEVTLDASGSSQFVSGLLLSGAGYRDGVRVRHVGAPVPSQPHIEMTVDMLRAAGVHVEVGTDDWRVHPGSVAVRDWDIEPDLSNATVFLAAAAVTGGEVTVPGWPQRTTQAGDRIRPLLAAMGCAVTLDERGLTVRGPDRIGGIEVDLHDVGELTPTVAALAALADGPSRLSGIAHLRGHETDRLAALSTEITALGGAVTETDDGLHIVPRALLADPQRPWRAYADHRMATAGALLGLVVPGVSVDDVASTAKTLPGFVERWVDMLAGSAG